MRPELFQVPFYFWSTLTLESAYSHIFVQNSGRKSTYHIYVTQAAILDVPFVDVIATMSDPKLPLTVTEYEVRRAN